MSAIAIVGLQWGDCGKGRLVDLLAMICNVVVRYQGGNNAGHTVINSYGRFALHLLPSGAFHSHVTNVIGPGVALNIPALLEEIENLVAAGVPRPNLLISDRAQVMLPYHLLLDAYEEERLAGEAFGSTKAGIAPFYSDLAAKIGIRVADLFDKDRLRDHLGRALARHNVLIEHLYHKETIEVEPLVALLLEQGRQIEEYVADTTQFLHEQLREGKRVLLEGQLGALRDLIHGIHPFTTSSSTLAGFASVGAGIPPREITRVIGVAKAYSSCVGAGPFVDEIFGEEEEALRDHGGDKGEYGSTTGRPRRMGWFDVVATRYGCKVQGATEVAFTVLDALGYLEQIPICVGYKIDGEVTTDFPVSAKLDRAKPVLEVMPGWGTAISHIREFDKLPEPAQKYVLRVEELIGAPITMVSVGPQRDEIIYR